MPLAWRTRSHDNGLLGALETVDHFLESGDPLLAPARGHGVRSKRPGGLVPRLRCDQAARETLSAENDDFRDQYARARTGG
jgi:hypothetical protein